MYCAYADQAFFSVFFSQGGWLGGLPFCGISGDVCGERGGMTLLGGVG